MGAALITLLVLLLLAVSGLTLVLLRLVRAGGLGVRARVDDLTEVRSSRDGESSPDGGPGGDPRPLAPSPLASPVPHSGPEPAVPASEAVPEPTVDSPAATGPADPGSSSPAPGTPGPVASGPEGSAAAGAELAGTGAELAGSELSGSELSGFEHGASGTSESGRPAAVGSGTGSGELAGADPTPTPTVTATPSATVTVTGAKVPTPPATSGPSAEPGSTSPVRKGTTPGTDGPAAHAATAIETPESEITSAISAPGTTGGGTIEAGTVRDVTADAGTTGTGADDVRPEPAIAGADPGLIGGAAVGAARVELARISTMVADLRREARDVEEEAERIRRRAEQDAVEQTARVRREAEQIRRHAEEAAAAIRERAVADAELRASRAEAAAREVIHAEREQIRAELDEDLRTQRTELRGWDSRLTQREQRVADQATGVEERLRRLETRETEMAVREAGLDSRESDLGELEEARRRELERVAGLTSTEARTELVKVVEDQARLDAAVRVRDIEARAEEEAEDRARRIVTLAIQRVASDQTAESVVSVLHLPSDEMKGRIIGREGRNIRAFESVTGVNVLIDDTPEAVLLSCFDPVRREMGRITLAALVSDGRIHPHRIEEEYARAEREVAAKCVRAGEDALIDVGIAEMHPELINLLGRLRYRTSYGQNVLAHLVESAHLAGIMAAELRLPPAIAKRGTLLHDLGKALTHEVEGSHAIVGAEIARRYGEHEDVVHAIEAHHNEVEPRSIGAVLTQAADQISGGRPGARRDSLESYVKRLERIEQIAAERPGVEKVFAMQAGREVRVMVVPELVDDVAAHLLARDVAKQIEDELTYPGQIRVTVVRETRAVGMAR
ncbi:ribonuclease Y [Parafrankia discariae]|uniref:ribonuclease Y n=1 Tax=Parafrankia discariae TaxID=365528 RepID=UPI00037AA51E|nr:ribonuclease Y [Parafrankia discariae]